MATKLKILATLLLLSSIAFSQTGTNKKDTCLINLPCHVANKIAIDLVKGDSIAAELTLTQDILKLTEAEVLEYKSIVDSYEIKQKNYKDQIDLYIQKDQRYEFIINGLEKDNKKLKRVTKILGFAVGVTSLTAVLGFVIH